MIGGNHEILRDKTKKLIYTDYTLKTKNKITLSVD